jgi:hypothetical protein
MHDHAAQIAEALRATSYGFAGVVPIMGLPETAHADGYRACENPTTTTRHVIGA